ncbi:MAG: ATP synthase F1 subunit epsilon [Thermoguttaceae bacterium]|jgi:F-type H+-transporting ATPase subunit epsilon
MSELRCIVVTPERTVLDREAWFVALPLYDGELGVAPGRSPMIGRLGCGELRLETGRGAERYYIEGGFVEVLNDRVSLLTERAIPAASLSELEAGEAVKAARGKPARSPEQMAIRDRAVDQARAQLRIARRNPK